MAQSTSVNAKNFTIEVTKTTMLNNLNDTIQKRKSLRDMGCEVALDNFGTGYSSLAYLRNLPLNEIKIDKSFVDELTTGEYLLVESMISIGRNMLLVVIAEGVETITQRELLVNLGCQRVQGYLVFRGICSACLCLNKIFAHG